MTPRVFNTATIIVSIVVICALGYFAYDVITFNAMDKRNEPALTDPPKVFTKSVALAKIYLKERGASVPCGKVDAVVVERVPTLTHSDGGAEPGICKIYMRRGWYKANLNQTASFCTLVFHELAHVAGVRHSSDPNNLMYPNVRIVPNECSRLALQIS